MDDTAIIATFNLISLRINQIVPLFIIITGTFGHICNLIIFSQRSQRRNPISVYFFSSSTICLIVLYIGVLIRYLQDIYNIDPVNNILVVCRIRSFIIYVTLSLSNWYILLGTIDRYLISCNDNHRRQMSTIKNAYRSIVFITIIFMLSYCHILILYNTQTFVNSFGNLQNFCYPQRGSYRIFSDIQILVQFSFLPPLLMSIFVILIIRNIHASHRRIANTVVAHHHARMRKRDLQLSKMLLAQVLITIICSLPLAVSQLLTTLTLTSSKTVLRLTIESFFALIARQLAFYNCSLSFYIYTLSGSQFRLELREIFGRITTVICHKRLLQKRRIEIHDDNNRPKDNVQQLTERPQQNTPIHVDDESQDTATRV